METVLLNASNIHKIADFAIESEGLLGFRILIDESV